VYDCSGPYSDPAVKIDIRAGLPALRKGWIEERGDTETLGGLSSEYGRAQAADPKLADLRFPGLKRTPRRAKPAAIVSQMHYARQGHHHAGDGIHRHPREPEPPRTSNR
jgi:phosphomethylpyrimidine synthase